MFVLCILISQAEKNGDFSMTEEASPIYSWSDLSDCHISCMNTIATEGQAVETLRLQLQLLNSILNTPGLCRHRHVGNPSFSHDCHGGRGSRSTKGFEPRSQK